MQELNTKPKGAFITQTEAAEILGEVVGSPRWYDIIADPDFPRLVFLPGAKRGKYQRRDIERIAQL